MPEPWWEILDGQMASREDRAPRRSIAINYPADLYALVFEAAKRRDISMTGYQRRASLAFACHDLQAEWEYEMQTEPPVGSFIRPGRGSDLQGRGYGNWKIVDLSEYRDA